MAYTSVLSSCFVGKLFVVNSVDGESCGNLDAKIISKYRDDCNAYYASKGSSGLPINAALNILRVVRDGNNIYHKTGKEIAHTGELYTVVSYESIVDKFNIETVNDSLATVKEAADKFCQNFKAKQYSELEYLENQILDDQRYNTENGYYKVAFDKSIKDSKNKLIWLSKEQAGTVLKSKICHSATSTHPADIARDNRGLIHYGLNTGLKKQKYCQLLVVLKIGIEELNNSLHRPTSIDALTSSRFRGAYGNILKGCRKWGRAIHLEAMSDTLGSLGTTEAVTLDFKPSKAEMRFLGFPRVPRGDHEGINDSYFESMVLNKRAYADIEKRYRVL